MRHGPAQTSTDITFFVLIIHQLLESSGSNPKVRARFFLVCLKAHVYFFFMSSNTKASLEVWKLRGMLSMPLNPVAIHHDSWAMKKFFSHALRRAGVERMDSGDSPSRRAA